MTKILVQTVSLGLVLIVLSSCSKENSTLNTDLIIPVETTTSNSQSSNVCESTIYNPSNAELRSAIEKVQPLVLFFTELTIEFLSDSIDYVLKSDSLSAHLSSLDSLNYENIIDGYTSFLGVDS